MNNMAAQCENSAMCLDFCLLNFKEEKSESPAGFRYTVVFKCLG